MKESTLNIKADRPSQLLNYFQLLWFRRRLILAITLVISIIGGFWLSEQVPVYRSTSSLMIGFPQAAAQDTAANGSTSGNINNEIEVLRSRELIHKVIKRFQLQVYAEFDPNQLATPLGLSGFVSSLKMSLSDWVSPPRENSAYRAGQTQEKWRETQHKRIMAATLDVFVSQLSVEQAGQSNLVNISFLSQYPQLAARIANALPEAYIKEQLQTKLDNSEAVSTWFAEQFKELKDQLITSERAEEYYRNTLGLAESERTELLDQQLSNLNSRIMISRAEKADAVARLSLLKSVAEDTDNFENAVKSLIVFPSIQQLISQKTALLKAADELSADGGLEQPKLASAHAEVAEINTEIRAEFNQMMVDLQNEVTRISEAADLQEAELTRVALQSGTQHRRLLQLQALEEETAINRIKFEAFIDRYKETSSTAETFMPDSKLVSLATASTQALYPGRASKILNVILSGLLIAVLLVFLLQLRNPGLLSPEHVEQVLGTRTIGVIPIMPGHKTAHNYTVEDPESDYVSAINALKITLDLADLDNKVRAIQLVSSVPGEGKSSLAISLAQAVAGFGQKVLLVNGDLRNSSIQEKLGLPLKTEGLTDLMLSNEGELQDYVTTDAEGGIHFLSAGTAMYADADVVFSSQRMESAVNKMNSQYDFIVFDAPPVSTNSDAIAISKHVDKTLFVIRWNKTPMNVARSALNEISEGAVDLAGIVLEQVNLQRYENIAYSDYGFIYNQRN